MDSLNPDEKLQSGVIKATKYLNGRLDMLRVKNDEAMPEADRALLVAEIAAIKGLKRFLEAKPILVPDTSHIQD